MKQEVRIKDQRHQLILQELTKEGKVYVSQMAQEFGLTPETLRRDLSELEAGGLLERVHGGAVSKPAPLELAFEKKKQVNQAEKQAVAQAAAQLVQSGMTLAVDYGTSTMYIADYLKDITNLTIVTNSLAAALHFNKAIEEDRVQGQVIILPGVTNPYQLAIKGSYTIEFLANFSFDLNCMSCGGLSASGVYDYDMEESHVSRQMAQASQEVVLVADHSKLGKKLMVEICPIKQVDLILCDCPKPAGWDLSDTCWQTVSGLGVEL
ncbi:transcriptional regulator, DeoR family [Eremococcus coleocola ACS-139-V-Col8]|uniref:Transcriptional regulator, DeoR family n=2 Tax=Eremococcus TaxID=171412 RepID=E4KMK2_9LACT|nr:transcriptional regulator, DeoR family [Eremococcus coleocola ACS-139-V-Col8]